MTGQMRMLLDREKIHKRVEELGTQINRDYAGQELILLGVLKGVFIFMADLARELNLPLQVDFVRLTSYGTGSESSGEVRITKDVELPIRDRHVLVVEDIVDSGLTLEFLRQHLKAHHPKSLKICCLIDKKERRLCDIPLDYVGFVVEKGFLVGYGLDCGEKNRTLPDVFEVEV
jgi:hypoxanthine phosphoribosyltransferase